jgi:pyruvate formate lyase activating enzyme
MNRRSFLKHTALCGLALGMMPALSGSPGNAASPSSGSRALFFASTKGNRVECRLCFRHCVIPDRRRGFCRVRENRRGELWSLVFGRPVGLQIDPIELEPMYHFVPGHKNLCVYTASCNFRCKHCQNWSVSQVAPEQISSLSRSPQEIVEEAIKAGCRSISHSINEPTIFYEMMLEVARQARQRGLLTLCHTNGGIAPGPLVELLKVLDGVTVDLKAFNEGFYRDICEARLEPVLATLKTIRAAGKHLEIVNLVIPTVNDQIDEIRSMSRFIVQHLGPEVPLHFTRFSPRYKMTHLPPTPIKTLEAAAAAAQKEGVRFVYLGNVVGHPGNSTYCPECRRMLIERSHFLVLNNYLRKGSCPSCNEKIPGIWDLPSQG